MVVIKFGLVEGSNDSVVGWRARQVLAAAVNEALALTAQPASHAWPSSYLTP